MFNRSHLLRAAVFAVGVTLGVPALAETDMIPIAGSRVGAASAEFTGRAGPAVAPAYSYEPSVVTGARGASGAFLGRTPLAQVAPNLSAVDAYGAALNNPAN